MDARRSQRIPLSTPLHLLSLDPMYVFSVHCNTVDVSCHGCRLVAPCAFQHKTRLRLTVLSSNRSTTAHVVRSIPVQPGPQVDAWYVAVELDAPGNVWGVESPPPDWLMIV